ncbi:hypothetical protein MKC91_05990 [[Clostridium] innocuum]|nr:hypothetical protein [Erysipelotrichaceae bacterium]MCR0383128.1 hypothetical protein [[Clostridium] innocuum]MCR0412271.1 hypothetical protein [[Clostridium] innocuum]MCR0533862.1 hypothetical protein [[Clostridium] innocuum]MCR0537947.1 hypothetical protein [[Clostridium] innocuum]
MKLTPDSAMKVAKDLTIVAMENGYVPKASTTEKAAKIIADFVLTVANNLCEDGINDRIHLEQ